jgi:hypothetical protein
MYGQHLPVLTASPFWHDNEVSVEPAQTQPEAQNRLKWQTEMKFAEITKTSRSLTVYN